MKTILSTLVYWAAVLATLARYDAPAASLDFGTANLTNWTASAGGAVDARPYQHNTDITVTSTGYASGVFLPGGNWTLFDGFWTAAYRFYLPADAINVSLTYSNLFADDRTVLELNGVPIDSAGVDPHPPHQIWYQFMVLTNGSHAVQWWFNSPNREVSGSVTSGFRLGETNVLEAILNNTTNGIYCFFLDTLTANNGTFFGVNGRVSYSLLPPRLNIALAGGSVAVSWPTNSGGFQLETSSNPLNPGGWSPVATVNNSYATPPTNQASFFRLVQ